MRVEEGGARVAARTLAEVLKEIKKTVVMEVTGAKLSLVWVGGGGMKVYRRSAGDAAFPAELAKEFL